MFKKYPFLPVIIIIITSVITYANTLNGGFVWIGGLRQGPGERDAGLRGWRRSKARRKGGWILSLLWPRHAAEEAQQRKRLECQDKLQVSSHANSRSRNAGIILTIIMKERCIWKRQC